VDEVYKSNRSSGKQRGTKGKKEKNGASSPRVSGKTKGGQERKKCGWQFARSIGGKKEERRRQEYVDGGRGEAKRT